MVRAFSFTDDSTNVRLFVKPLPSQSSPQLSLTPSDWQLRHSTPSLQLWQIRRLQSSWYQSLFQSHPSALAEPWQSRCKALNEMQHWVNTLADSVPPPLQLPIRSEILYSSILLIWPPGMTTEMDHHGKSLILQYSIDYADVTWNMCMSGDSTICTYLDVSRAFFVGRRLLEVLQGDYKCLLDSKEFEVSVLSNEHVTPPTFIKTRLEAKVKDTTHSVQCLIQIIDTLGKRFEIPTGYDGFKRQSANVLQSLHSIV